MTKNKIVIFLTVFFLIVLSLWADWKKDVIKYLFPMQLYSTLTTKLEPRFENIPEEDKGALALILAFSYCRLDNSKKMGYWFERYLRDFWAKDNDLTFLLNDLEKLTKEILKFRDAGSGLFLIYLIESPSKPETDIVKIKYFELTDPLKISATLPLSVSCNYELYDSAKRPLKRGRVNKEKNIIDFPINSDFLKGNSGNESFFELSLVMGEYPYQYRIHRRIVFVLDYQYPIDKIRFDPKTGGVEVIGEDIKFRYRQETKYYSKLAFDKDQFKKSVFPNLAAGVGLFLLNSLAVNKLYNSLGSSPDLKANLDGSRIAINLFSIGFGLKGLYNLFTKKVFYKKTASKTISIPEEIHAQDNKQINSIKDQIFVLISLKPLKML
jgi:hypothetical protein